MPLFRWLTLCLFVFLLALLFVFPQRTSGDVALYLDIGGRLLQGQRPYIDFMEINIPVIHYVNTAPVWISHISGLDEILVFNLLTFVLLAGSAWMCQTIAGKAFGSHSVGVWLLPFVLVAGSIINLNRAYGQREHLFVLLAFPYLLLRTHRWNDGSFSGISAFVIGIAAAIGTSLKPWFALVVLVPELYHLIVARKWRSLVQWEIGGVISVIGIYLIYALANPDLVLRYTSEVAPSIAAGYGGYTNVSLSELILGDFSMIGFIVLVVAAWWLSATSSLGMFSKWVRTLTLVATGAYLCYVLQFKGWQYHRVPLTFSVLLLLSFLVWGISRRASFTMIFQRWLRRQSARRALAIATGIFVTLWCVTIFLVLTESPFGEATTGFRDLIRTYGQPGNTVLAVDASVYPNYPALQQLDLQPVATYPVAYPLVFAYYISPPPTIDAVYQADHVPQPLAQQYIEAFIADVENLEPDMIVLQNYVCLDCDYQINTARYMQARPQVARLLARWYRLATEDADYVIYLRIDGAQ